jgi:hypothetical protein
VVGAPPARRLRNPLAQCLCIDSDENRGNDTENTIVAHNERAAAIWGSGGKNDDEMGEHSCLACLEVDDIDRLHEAVIAKRTMICLRARGSGLAFGLDHNNQGNGTRQKARPDPRGLRVAVSGPVQRLVSGSSPFRSRRKQEIDHS